MKKLLISLLLVLPLSFSLQRCATLSQLGLIPTEFEMITGLKDALSQGMFASFDAFNNPTVNPLLQFAFPGEAANIEKALRDLGLGQVVDQATGKLTRAMGDAVTAAKPIFVNSIKQLTVKDALNILVTDNNRAATDYFKRTSQPMLMSAFRPIVDSTVKVAGADKDYNRLATAYNALPFTRQKLETNITDFIAARAIDGMMLIIGNEEEKIRTQYEFRKTDMMRKAFGYAEQELKRRQVMGR
ncbi:MAG TPA: DUF4197 domain-containing protein [Phnomibacter sp.]|nr:DUF4197 domain-containing protein [Phnomibacter sp.]